jgi:hypothetical protein
MRTRVLRERFPGVRADRLRGVLAPGVVKDGRLSEGLGFADQLGDAIKGDAS